MKWLAILLVPVLVCSSCACWRPYYGQTYATPAVAQQPYPQAYPQVVQSQPQVVVAQPQMVAQPQYAAQPQVMAAPTMQPCQPCCVPCY